MFEGGRVGLKPLELIIDHLQTLFRLLGLQVGNEFQLTFRLGFGHAQKPKFYRPYGESW